MPSQVLDMEFPDAADLCDYWAMYPPAHESALAIAVFCGYKPAAKPQVLNENDPSGMGALFERFGGNVPISAF